MLRWVCVGSDGGMKVRAIFSIGKGWEVLMVEGGISEVVKMGGVVSVVAEVNVKVLEWLQQQPDGTVLCSYFSDCAHH